MKEFLLGLVKALLLTTEVVVVTFGVWVYVRGSNSIEVPAAWGITIWQFIQERWDAYKAVDVGMSVLPEYLHFNLLSGRMVTVNGC